MKPPATAPTATWVDDPPTDTITATAPSAAPELKPMMSGDPSGLRTSAWKIAPDMPNAAPTPMATSTRGRRSVPTMNSESAVGLPKSVATTSDIGIGKSPTLIDQQPITTITIARTAHTPIARGSRRTENLRVRIARPRIGSRSGAGGSWIAGAARGGSAINGHSCAIRVRRTRSTNTGPPMAAVMMPTWISPGRAMIRPAVSQ